MNTWKCGIVEGESKLDSSLVTVSTTRSNGPGVVAVVVGADETAPAAVDEWPERGVFEEIF